MIEALYQNVSLGLGENPARASELLAALFAPEVVACELREEANPGLLLPEEAAACAHFRPKRSAEFAGGRLCARRALGVLGFPGFALRQNPDRTPAWPAAIVGSITHTAGFIGAVAAKRTAFAGIGVDAEIVGRVTPELWPMVLTREDTAHVATRKPPERERTIAAIFSAKEAFYKCQSGITGRWLDFADASVEVSPEDAASGTFVLRAAQGKAALPEGFEARGRYRFSGDIVVSGIALDADGARGLLVSGTSE